MDDFLTHQHSDELSGEVDMELERELLADEAEDTYRTTPGPFYRVTDPWGIGLTRPYGEMQ